MLARAGLGLMLGLAAMAVALAAPVEESSRVFTNALPPPTEALDRLNLKMSWRGYVPMDGRRDGFARIQIHYRNLLVQTRSGLVSLLDAETGRTLWSARPGQAYQPPYQLAYNNRNVFVVNGSYLFALKRDTGATEWQLSLPAGLSAPPVADDDLLYLSTVNTRLYAYRLPRSAPGTPEKKRIIADVDPSKRPVLPQDKYQRSTPSITYFTSVRQAGSDLNTGPVPSINWSMVANVPLELAPVYSKTLLFVASPNGTYFAMDKNLDEIRSGAFEIYRAQTDGSITVPPAAYEDIAYVGSDDANLYAINIERGQVQWRFTAGTSITREPAVTTQDVYVVSRRGGLARVDRNSGDPAWRIPRGNQVLTGNPDASRFLAVNPKFVYASDASGRLLVLDRQRGRQLSIFDTRSFAFPVANDVTDRLYLAANNGLIVCLHDRDYPEPYRYRQLEEQGENQAAMLRDILNKPITEKGQDQLRPLRDVLSEFAKRYHFQLDMGDRAFKAEKREPVSDLPVKVPPVDNVPLKDVLQKLLEPDPINARFEAIGDTILVLPAKPKAP